MTTAALRRTARPMANPANRLIAKLHIAKSQLRLDDDTYRDTLERITGKRSSKDMTEREMRAVLDHFVTAGFQDRSLRGRKDAPAGRMAGKINALWLSGWNLGVIHDPAQKAMDAFILRQTGIAKAQWLKDAHDARKVIEALKKWLAREGGVAFSSEREKHRAEALRNTAWLVIEAQWRKLNRGDDVECLRQALAFTQKLSANQLGPKDFIAIQKAMGTRIREQQKKDAA